MGISVFFILLCFHSSCTSRMNNQTLFYITFHLLCICRWKNDERNKNRGCKHLHFISLLINVGRLNKTLLHQQLRFIFQIKSTNSACNQMISFPHLFTVRFTPMSHILVICSCTTGIKGKLLKIFFLHQFAQRICQVCNLGIRDEVYFLIESDSYKTIRKTLLHTCTELRSQFKFYTNMEKLSSLWHPLYWWPICQSSYILP